MERRRLRGAATAVLALPALLAVALAGVASGGVQREAIGGATVYSCAWWYYVCLVFAVNFVFLEFAALMWTRARTLSCAFLMLAAAVAAILLWATLPPARLTIDGSGVRAEGCCPNYDLRFADLRSVRLIQVRNPASRRAGDATHVLKLVVRDRAGTSVRQAVGDLDWRCWRRLAAAFREHGVEADIDPSVTWTLPAE